MYKDRKETKHVEVGEEDIHHIYIYIYKYIYISKISTTYVNMVTSRDGNFCPTHEYPAQPDPTGPGFTQSD